MLCTWEVVSDVLINISLPSIPIFTAMNASNLQHSVWANTAWGDKAAVFSYSPNTIQNCDLHFIEAPAIQLAEHAQAILADDAALGVRRSDPVLQRLASGSSHAATCLQQRIF